MTAARRRRADLLGGVLLLLALLLLGAAGAAFAMLRPPPVDEATLCRTDAAPAAHTILLVDATDRLEPRHRKRLETAITQERARLAPYDRLTILALRPERPQEPRVLFSMCLPRDAATANPLFENPARLQAQWDESIGKALRSATHRAGAASPAPISPILAALRAAAADPDFDPRVAKRRLVLISDLLENDPAGYSAYRPMAEADRARATARPAALSDVSVRVITLDRPEDAARQDVARETLWTNFFSASDARDVAWDPTG